jgi:putative ABC transport system permease protein
MVAISAGLKPPFRNEITSLGSNLLFVQSSFSRGGPPGSGGSGGLVFDDAAAIAGRSPRGQSGDRGATILTDGQSQWRDLEDVAIHGSTADFPSVRDMNSGAGSLFQ